MSTYGYIFAVEDKRYFCFGAMRNLMALTLDDGFAADVQKTLLRQFTNVTCADMEALVWGVIRQVAKDGNASNVEIVNVVNALTFAFKHPQNHFFVRMDEIAFEIINESWDRQGKRYEEEHVEDLEARKP